MKHLIATILMVFAFFSLSNAQQHQDYAKALSDTTTFRNLILNEVDHLKKHKRCSHNCDVAESETFTCVKEDNDDRITNVFIVTRNKYLRINTDGSTDYDYSTYYLGVWFTVNSDKLHVECNYERSTANTVSCNLHKEHEYQDHSKPYKSLQIFEINYSVILEVVNALKKRNYKRRYDTCRN